MNCLYNKYTYHIFNSTCENIKMEKVINQAKLQKVIQQGGGLPANDKSETREFRNFGPGCCVGDSPQRLHWMPYRIALMKQDFFLFFIFYFYDHIFNRPKKGEKKFPQQ